MGIKLPSGFRANGLNCGLKRKKKDLALIYSDSVCEASALFTPNRFKAAPVTLSIKNLRGGRAQAVVINSANANCSTGRAGYADALSVNKAAAKALSLPLNRVIVASTGVIGKRLDAGKIIDAVPSLVKGLSQNGIYLAAEAMMTTDSFMKVAHKSIDISGRRVSIVGMAKGAGMISPNMATMLAVFMTDAGIEKAALRRAFKDAVMNSFNSITVDGDMSTNDMAAILANGRAGNTVIGLSSASYKKFSSALNDISLKLALMIIKDGEGATRSAKIEVTGASSKEAAERAARRIAESPLLKTMLYGTDPNPGRIVAALGASGVKIGKKGADIYICGKHVFKGEAILPHNRSSLKKAMTRDMVDVRIVLKEGRHARVIYTCDLTPAYININKGYS
ncbi:MAG: bifunctional ornithine acetyltransferase/N-acetylglutamate synthase [Candidatus Omnitrophica bacterium CG1_02_49_10]|nr:MAG: bifunctional ornithine acetyltransferase/N-acetylglutamate synthase [Candidatus Omnitrophica bacterium CG1_02_49_10]